MVLPPTMAKYAFWKPAKTDVEVPLLNDVTSEVGKVQQGVVEERGPPMLSPTMAKFAFWKPAKTDVSVPLLSDVTSEVEIAETEQQHEEGPSMLSPTMAKFAFWKPTKTDVEVPLLSHVRSEVEMERVLREAGKTQRASGEEEGLMMDMADAVELTECAVESACAESQGNVRSSPSTESIAGSQAESLSAPKHITPPAEEAIVAPTTPTRSIRPRLTSTASMTSAHTPSAKKAMVTTPSPQRLRRPAELNLSTPPPSHPRSELEQRHAVIRNSSTQAKVALRSPTALLAQRLSTSPKFSPRDEAQRVFTPPKLSANGCILPGPGGSGEAFTSASVRAWTEGGKRPAWWCKVDGLVVFDGVEMHSNGEEKYCARTSKGLSVARRRGELETVVVPMDCAHCQDMLRRREWKYDVRVCQRSVCWDCRERCGWEREQEQQLLSEGSAKRAEANRVRADSVLQDDDARDENLLMKIGVEQGRPKSPIDFVGGIDERLNSGQILS